METAVVARSSDLGLAPVSSNESDLGPERADPFCMYSCPRWAKKDGLLVDTAATPWGRKAGSQAGEFECLGQRPS